MTNLPLGYIALIESAAVPRAIIVCASDPVRQPAISTSIDQGLRQRSHLAARHQHVHPSGLRRTAGCVVDPSGRRSPYMLRSIVTPSPHQELHGLEPTLAAGRVHGVPRIKNLMATSLP